MTQVFYNGIVAGSGGGGDDNADDDNNIDYIYGHNCIRLNDENNSCDNDDDDKHVTITMLFFVDSNSCNATLN